MLAFLRKLAVAGVVGTSKAAPAPVKPMPPAATRTSTKKSSRIVVSAAVAACCTSVIGGYEALRTTAYRDIVGIPTICWGETQGVRMGDRKTVAECNALFVRRLDEFATHVEACVPSTREMPVERYAAHLSLAYNIGWGSVESGKGYCGSSVARLQNAGRTAEACQAFAGFNKVSKGTGKAKVFVVSQGLVNRRAQERALCLKGL